MSKIHSVTWAVFTKFSDESRIIEGVDFAGKTVYTMFGSSRSEQAQAFSLFYRNLHNMRNSNGRIERTWIEAGVVLKSQTIRAVSDQFLPDPTSGASV